MSLKFNITQPRRDFTLKLQGEFNPGITGIFGSSGAGKTSFFKLLTGIDRPDKGYISLGKRVLTDTERSIHIPIYKRKIGVVFQENLLFPHLTIKENLLFGKPYVKKQKINFDKTVDILNLSPILSSKPGTISGGEVQRTAIGRALLTCPEMLLLDEPFNALNYELRSEILTYIKTLSRTLDIPILIISHDYNDLTALTNSFYMIEQGEKVKDKMYVC